MAFNPYTATLSDGSTDVVMILDTLDPLIQARKHYDDPGVTVTPYVAPEVVIPTFTGPFGGSAATITPANASVLREAILDAKALDETAVAFADLTGTVAEAQALYAGYLAASK